MPSQLEKRPFVAKKTRFIDSLPAAELARIRRASHKSRTGMILASNIQRSVSIVVRVR
jgi:hypothetical protein